MHRKINMFLLLGYLCLATVSSAMITPALPSVEKFFSLTHGDLEWVVSLFLFGYVIAQLFYGPLTNRLGGVQALRLGLMISIVGAGLSSLAVYGHFYSLLLLGQLITAIGAASGLTCTFFLISQCGASDDAKRALSYTALSFAVGRGLAVFIGSIVTEYSHWQKIFYCLIFYYCLMILLSYQLPTSQIKKNYKIHYREILLGYRRTLQNKTLICFSLVFSIATAVSYCYSAASPIYAEQILSLSAAQYGYWNFLITIGMISSSFISTRLMIRRSPGQIINVGMMGMLICFCMLILLAFIQVKNPIWFFSICMLLFVVNGLLIPAATFIAINTLDDKASASSMMSFLNMLGAMIAVIFLGYLPFSALVSFLSTLVLFYIFICLILYKYQNSRFD